MLADDVEERLEANPGRHVGGFCVRFGLQLATIGAPLDPPATRQGHRERHQQFVTIADDVADRLGGLLVTILVDSGVAYPAFVAPGSAPGPTLGTSRTSSAI